MILHIPSIGLHTEVELEKDSSLLLPWKVKYSSFPDQEGNLVLAGHSYTYANPFNPVFFFLDQLSIQDGIEVLWKKKVFSYEIYDILIVLPSEVDVMKNRFKSEITLYTCYPKLLGDKRLIIKAKLVSIE
jgi:LPXTG-site transpeptidase (sortase) family protein